jgi:hypothetical protein
MPGESPAARATLATVVPDRTVLADRGDRGLDQLAPATHVEPLFAARFELLASLYHAPGHRSLRGKSFSIQGA